MNLRQTSFDLQFSQRRTLLQSAAAGFGWLAFQALAAKTAHAASEDTRSNSTSANRPNNGGQTQAVSSDKSPLTPKPPHFPARAKRVIFLFMQGAPSHLETFDWKPELKARHGKTAGMPGSRGKLLAPQFDFQPRGKSGLPISSLFPQLCLHADDLCLLNGLHTSNAAHPQATIALHTGSVNFVRPSLGAWVTYGLGSSNQNLPGFVTLNPSGPGGAQNYGSSFLPASFQGTRIQPEAGGIADIRTPHQSSTAQRTQLDLIQQLNHGLLSKHPGNAELEGLIQSCELAFRMQSSVPEVLDLREESPQTLARYGIDNRESAAFGRQCLMARRLAEAGVRFIQITRGGWDQHRDLRESLQRNCSAIDLPIAGLLQDLKDRDLLRDTLVIWGGEFGRSPQEQATDGDGRRHNNLGFSMWMAGAGVRGGIRYGATDELGEKAVENRMSTHDLHATILHLLGLDHTRLTFRYSGRDFRLTDVYGEVATGILS